MGHILSESISKYVKDKIIIWNSQHRLTKGKPCLTNPLTFNDEMTAFVGKGRLVNVIHLGTSKVLDAASHGIFIWKLRKYRLERRTQMGWKLARPPVSKDSDERLRVWLVADNNQRTTGHSSGGHIANHHHQWHRWWHKADPKSVDDTKLGTVTES